MKLSTIHYQYMGELHAKFHQNWWSGFREKRAQDTQGHSFIIIRIIRILIASNIEFVTSNKKPRFDVLIKSQLP